MAGQETNPDARLETGAGAVAAYLGTITDLLIKKGLLTKEELGQTLDILNVSPLDAENKAKFALVRRMIERN